MNSHKDNFADLQKILKQNYANDNKSSLITFNDDLNNLDKKLESLINERDGLLNKKNQFVLDQERVNNSLKLISLQEKNLQISVNQLANSHSEWIKKGINIKKSL